MIKDIINDFKNSAEQAGLISKLTPAHIIAVMLTAILCGVVIYIVYKAFYRGAVYSESFNVLTVLTTVVTAFIIMTISTNLVLSLGMVGALSIVRFRSAIKDPLDIGFLFWAIAAGITSGAGLYPLALIGSGFIAVVYIAFVLLGRGKTSFILVVKYTDEAKSSVEGVLAGVKNRLKSKAKYKELNELTVQIKSKSSTDISVLDKLLEIEGVENAVMVEYTGE
ncbi:MAG: DUF4956 domain-containing protein [Clostridiales bacterium]|nr:DUF4956 domain-containing protein [Clostridiales bacterium]